MSITALSSGLAGMLSSQRALDVSANNIANASTPGYKAERVGVTQPSSDTVTLTGASDNGTDLATEIVSQISSKASFDASAKVVKTADEVLGTLIDIKA
jgi:flagellar basal-body rod protein FlgC